MQSTGYKLRPNWSLLISSAFILVSLLGLSLTLNAQPSQVRIIAIGDSLTAGYGLKQDQGFTAQLQARLGSDGIQVTIINAGVSGDTTTGGLARLDWVLSEPYDGVILALGANDALRAVPTDLVRENLTHILEQITSRDLDVLFCGFLAPRNLGEEYVQEFDSIYQDLALAFDVVFYPHFLENVATDSKLNQSDGIHPNADGVGVIVDSMLPYVKELIERASTS